VCFSQQAIHEQALVPTDNNTQLTDAIGSTSYVTYQAIMTVFCFWFKSRVMRHHSELWSLGLYGASDATAPGSKVDSKINTINFKKIIFCLPKF